MVKSLLLASVTLAWVAPVDALALQQEPTVRIWTDKGPTVKTGDRVRLYVETIEDGYLLVVHAEPDGRIRFLYPLDPYRDNFVRAGRSVEIRGRGDREAIRVYHDGGFGTVYAAFFRDPFEYRDFIFGDHWDYRALESYRLDDERDPEAELTAIVQHVAGQTFFEYDLINYGVGQAVAAERQTYVSVGLGYGYPYYGSAFSFGISFGNTYPYHRRYYTLYNCGPYWYDAWTCGSWYRAAYGWYTPFPYWRSYWGYNSYGYYYPYSYYYPYTYYRPYYGDPYYYGSYPRAPSRYRVAYGSSGHDYLGKYAFKPDQGRTLTGGIGMRNRTVRTASTSRRAGPSTVALGNRRVAPSTTTTRRQSSSANGNRDARATGWGITNGRRTIAPTRQPVRQTTVQADQGRRTLDRTTVRRPDETAGRRTETTARRATGSSSTADRAINSQRRTTSNEASSSSRRSVDQSQARRREATTSERPTRQSPTRATDARGTSRVRPSTGTTPRRATSPTASSRVRVDNSRAATPRRSTQSQNRVRPQRSTQPQNRVRPQRSTQVRPQRSTQSRQVRPQRTQSNRSVTRTPTRTTRPSVRTPTRTTRPSARPAQRTAPRTVRPAPRPTTRSARPTTRTRSAPRRPTRPRPDN